MAINYPGPYEIRLRYATTPSGLAQIEHEARYNLDLDGTPTPGDGFDTITVKQRGGSTAALDTTIDSWVTTFKAMFPATTDIIGAELWKYTAGTFQSSYVSSYDISEIGTSGGDSIAAQQAILTFRTVEGGIMRLSFMETPHVIGSSQSFPTSQTGVNALAAVVVASSNWILARDTSYPIFAYRFHPGQNEALFKKRFRQT